MPQEQTSDNAQASRMASNAEASSSLKAKTKAQEQREQQIQKWLESRAPRRQDTPGAQKQGKIGDARQGQSKMVTPKHRLLNSHNYPVACIVFSPNSELLATASRDVRIYDVKTGEIKIILDGHGGLVRSIAFTHDGRLLCSGSDDCTALVWSLEHCFALCVPGKIITLTPPGCPSSTNMPTNDQRTLLPVVSNTPQDAGNKEKESNSAANFSPMSRVIQRVLKRHHKPVLAVATTPDSKYLITGSADKTVRVWDVCTGYIMATLRGHSGEVNTVAVTPNGRRIVSSGADRVIFVWDFVTGDCKRALRGHKGPVSCMSVAPDGNFLVTGGHDKTLRVWDLINGNELATLSAHAGAFGVLSCAVSSDGSTIMSGGYDNLVKLWDATSGLALATIQGHRHMVSSVAFSPNCTHIATAGRDDEVRTWVWEQSSHLLFSSSNNNSNNNNDNNNNNGGDGGAARSTAGSETALSANSGKRTSDRQGTSKTEDTRNNRHWGLLFEDNSGKEAEDAAGMGSGTRPPSIAPDL